MIYVYLKTVVVVDSLIVIAPDVCGGFAGPDPEGGGGTGFF